MRSKDGSETPIWLRDPGNLYEVNRQMKRLGLGGQPREVLPVVAKVLLSDRTEAGRERGRDILWVMASLGSKEACAGLAKEISTYVDEEEMPLSKARDLSDLAARWEVLSTMSAVSVTPAAPLHSAKGAVRRRFQVEPPEPAGDDAFFGVDDADVLEPPRERSDKGFVILRSVGDPGTNEGRNIAARYADVIGRPLPYLGRRPERGEIAAMIESEFPWADNVGRDLERRIEISASMGGGRQTFKPVLLLGPSGSGKTSLAVRLAEVFGRRLTVIPAGGTSDSAGVGAVTRGWAGARPCGPFLAAVEAGCCDPAILIDEIDKSPRDGGQNGSVSGALHGMLNFDMPFQDACLMAGVDLSHMMFLATANSLARLPGSLVDRFDVMVVRRPEPQHFPVVLETMRKIVAAENNAPVEMMPMLARDEADALYDFFTQGSCSLRTFEKAFTVMLSEAASRERAMPN